MRKVSAEEIRSSLQGNFFQHFCGRFLKGQNYGAVHYGPMGQGDNDRGCDLFGSRGPIQFVGHCKACASSGETGSELKEAVLNAAYEGCLRYPRCQMDH
jgi:hypothetical protein